MMQRYACARCQDWGTLDPGGSGAKNPDMRGATGAGLEYCGCALGQQLQADADVAGAVNLVPTDPALLNAALADFEAQFPDDDGQAL